MNATEKLLASTIAHASHRLTLLRATKKALELDGNYAKATEYNQPIDRLVVALTHLRGK